MRFPEAIAAVAAVLPVTNAHGGPAIPQIRGLDMRDLKARNFIDSLKSRSAELSRQDIHEEHALQGRQTASRCGLGYGSCPAGNCCSVAGWCGTTGDFCYSPGCQYQYGPGCPENMTPAGRDTSTVSRPKVGSIRYGGTGHGRCVVPGTVALTFDDGPVFNYTDHVMDILQSYNAKATFFISGNNMNKGAIDTDAGHVASIKRMASKGHHIASHTWTHLDLSKITESERRAQMIKNEMALRNILGYFPTYMRPPYSSCTVASGCAQTMADLGYHIIYFDVDTDDYNQVTPEKIQNSKNWFRGNITANGATSASNRWLSIAHDIHPQTAYNLTEYMLSTLTSLGYRAVTLGECLGDDAANWYRTDSGAAQTVTTARTATSRSSTAPTASASSAIKVSTDGRCGTTFGTTCSGSVFKQCCSQYGWCGFSNDHCLTGCQAAYGTCGGTISSATTPSAASTIKTSTKTSAPTSSSTSTIKVSTDGRCGTTFGTTCTGSVFKQCCSQYGWCGFSNDHCLTGCQAAYGTCTK